MKYFVQINAIYALILKKSKIFSKRKFDFSFTSEPMVSSWKIPKIQLVCKPNTWLDSVSPNVIKAKEI